MGYRELSRIEIVEVVRRWQVGESQRAIARASGVARETVKKYLRAAEELGLAANGPPPTEDQLMRLVKAGRVVSAPRTWAGPPGGSFGAVSRADHDAAARATSTDGWGGCSTQRETLHGPAPKTALRAQPTPSGGVAAPESMLEAGTGGVAAPESMLEAGTGGVSAPESMLEAGIKALGLPAPLTRGGATWLSARGGVGLMVLLGRVQPAARAPRRAGPITYGGRNASAGSRTHCANCAIGKQVWRTALNFYELRDNLVLPTPLLLSEEPIAIRANP